MMTETSDKKENTTSLVSGLLMLEGIGLFIGLPLVEIWLTLLQVVRATTPSQVVMETMLSRVVQVRIL